MRWPAIRLPRPTQQCRTVASRGIAGSCWHLATAPELLAKHRSREDQPQVDYNPFVAKLRAADEAIERLELRRVDLVDLIAWAAHFNLAEEVDEVARLRVDLDGATGEFARLEADIAELEAKSRLLDSQTPGIESDVRLGSRAGRLLTSEYESVKARLNALRTLPAEHDRAKSRLLAHTKEIARVRERLQVAGKERARVTSEIAELTDGVAERERAIERFRGFVPGEVDGTIAQVDGELSRLKDEWGHLSSRAMDVDRAVEAPLAELQKYEVEIEDHESATSKLRSELSRLERRVDEVERIRKKLSDADNSYERAKLHEECEREFGYGKPGDALREIRGQMRPLRNSIAEHEHTIRRIRRDMAKTEKRVTDLAAVAAREIEALIIDGNNCCYRGEDLIGLAALIPMTESLANRYAVTVVFDAAIRRRLGVGDGHLHAALPSATVHVVASGIKADETILDAADKPATWVISNDRFGDFRDKASVKEGRVIRHEILADRVLVHDLGVNEPLVEPRLTSTESQL